VFDRPVWPSGGSGCVASIGGTAVSKWLVFDADGVQARASIPREREIRAIGSERIYALERDEYDVEYVRGYRLLR
jgi:hypothetical protein